MVTHVMPGTMWAYQPVGPCRFVRHNIDAPTFEHVAEAYVTNMCPVEQVQTAVEMASRPTDDQIKVVLTGSG